MSSRQIKKLGNTVLKVVPTFDCLENVEFPIWDDTEEIYKILDGVPQLCKSAVIQQYNEYIIYNELRANSKILAPILNCFWDERNLPILQYPIFKPFAADENFYQLSDEENLIQLGILGAHFGYDLKYISNFIKEVREICEEFNLREDDILCNLSNIGFNPNYGIRVIDYGLIDENDFRLVI